MFGLFSIRCPRPGVVLDYMDFSPMISSLLKLNKSK